MNGINNYIPTAKTYETQFKDLGTTYDDKTINPEESYNTILIFKVNNKLVKIDGLERLRISSIETTELNEDVLEVLKNNKVIVDHLHIPLQAGTNKILEAMNRKYDLDYFYNKISEINNNHTLFSVFLQNIKN